MASLQEELIGAHPTAPDLFGKWLANKDLQIKAEKPFNCQRNLITKEDYAAFIDEIANLVINHHVSAGAKQVLEEKKKIYNQYEFSKIVNELKLLPKSFNTQKGNVTEVLCSEYLQKTTGLTPFVYKLTYNWNTDQSMKGDDVLLFNEKNVFAKVLSGECKFRAKPTLAALKQIESMPQEPKSILPLAQRLLEDTDENRINLGKQLMDLQLDVLSRKVKVINVGFYCSNQKIGDFVQRNLNSKNPNLVLITLGLDNPNQFVIDIMERAQEKLEK